ncbi:uncharacterized protein LOC124494908 isoform X1 [Dermatophagoides farinae]|uniref:Uncharacterized protein n=1 Tax=Dermatophagoides farinae TaxID=6954 RepID=A0A922HWU1_DERFA|nr:uncharacterized protein LOC124494908 [Dermatophagoides farinae]KAH7636965.1 hypothetical protein HUG17_7171 [Dermatophagoides farinae]KAH9510709.1 hypothetical protein DERF_009218 [Dermatophagoides farinae]
MSAQNEMKHIFKSLIVDLKENFSEEFDQMKLYENVGVLEKNAGKMLKKYNGYMTKVEKQLDSRLEVIKTQDKFEKNLDHNMDDESIQKIVKIITDMNEIKEMNKAILETKIEDELKEKEIDDLKQTLELLKNEPLKSIDQLLQQQEKQPPQE